MSRNHEESDTDETFELLDRARHGDAGAFDRLFGRHREGLRCVVARRLDRSLRGRLDPSDVVQETQMEALKSGCRIIGGRPMPFRVWLFSERPCSGSPSCAGMPAALCDVGREQSFPEVGPPLVPGRTWAMGQRPASSSPRGMLGPARPTAQGAFRSGSKILELRCDRGSAL